MQERLQHRIQQYEMLPPEGSWQHIASALDQDFNLQEQRVAQKLEEAQLDPPAQAIQNIFDELDKAKLKPAPVKTIPSRRWVAAAAILLLIAGGWWWFNAETSKDLANTIPTTDGRQNQLMTPKRSGEPIMKENTGKESALALRIPQKFLLSSVHTIQGTETEIPITDSLIEEIDATALNDDRIQTADATPEAGIEAPLIRDGKGQLILDLSLLTTANGQYINITGPNGEQTRISAKFAKYLTYLRGTTGKSEDYLEMVFRSGYSWKKRFEEWRSKMMETSDFIPSSMNFLDILELKELLKENQ